MTTVSKIFAVLKEVIDPTKNRDIVELGYVQNIAVSENRVTFDIVLESPDHPFVRQLKEGAEKAVRQLIGITEVDIQLKAHRKGMNAANPLKNIKYIIAVSSCKGGVGKSTLAVHIAQELANRNLKVGLVDCDIYGPSLPTLLNLPKVNIYTNENQKLIPVEHNKLKLMSFGFLLGDNAAVMRGPIVTRHIQQILINTEWGDLDYLIIDMPPGTGDVHLTITQTIRLTGAVIVTTPHTLSLIDVARGILMFEKVSVPILGVIENMAYFQSPGSAEKHYLFGQPSAQTLKDRFGVSILADIPVLKALGQLQTAPQQNAYIQQAVDELLKSLERIKAQQKELPDIHPDSEKIRLIWQDGRVWEVKNFDLRLNSQDALSIDEMTGKSRLKPADIRKDIAAKEITPLGNYAIGITWNDGHSAGIYSYKLIERLAQKT
ncbi:MAG TPA: P-loop NTPase [Candidatus Omnitrophota bacterium]|nr:P-loop NTPase [Candidatus Omnitrophota bacterium]